MSRGHKKNQSSSAPTPQQTERTKKDLRWYKVFKRFGAGILVFLGLGTLFGLCAGALGLFQYSVKHHTILPVLPLIIPIALLIIYKAGKSVVG